MHTDSVCTVLKAEKAPKIYNVHQYQLSCHQKSHGGRLIHRPCLKVYILLPILQHFGTGYTIVCNLYFLCEHLEYKNAKLCLSLFMSIHTIHDWFIDQYMIVSLLNTRLFSLLNTLLIPRRRKMCQFPC